MTKPILTIIIPTHNRSGYLKRALSYYIRSDYKILIVDSSKKPINKLPPQNTITYLHYPNEDYISKLFYASTYIDSKYCLICADDDFLLLKSIHTLIDFLESNPNYSSVQGEVFGYIPNTSTLRPLYIQSRMKNYCDNDLVERLKEFFTNYIPIYYTVVLAEVFKTSFDTAYHKKYPEVLLTEILYSFVAICLGFNKTLPVCYSIRELSNESTYDSSFNIESYWLDSEFSESKNKLIEILAGILIITNGNEFNDAKNTCEKLLNIYVFNRARRKNASIVKKVMSKLDLRNYSSSHLIGDLKVSLEKYNDNNYKTLFKVKELPSILKAMI